MMKKTSDGNLWGIISTHLGVKFKKKFYLEENKKMRKEIYCFNENGLVFYNKDAKT